MAGRRRAALTRDRVTQVTDVGRQNGAAATAAGSARIVTYLTGATPGVLQSPPSGGQGPVAPKGRLGSSVPAAQGRSSRCDPVTCRTVRVSPTPGV